MNAARLESDDTAVMQQALLRRLRQGHSIDFGVREGADVLYHDGHTFVRVGIAGHGGRFYEVLRTDAEALTVLGSAIVEPVHDASVPLWSGVNISAADPWRTMLGRVAPGRPASPWDAAFRRATPMQRAAIILSISLGVFVAIGAAVYVKEEVLGLKRPVPAVRP